MMKNPFRHHHQQHAAPGDTLAAPRVPDTPAELFEGHWKHLPQDVDHDCARDPGSDLHADWELEGAAAEETLDTDSERGKSPRKPPRAQ
jgi:hypothetical protein